jgi:hypothetical protein
MTKLLALTLWLLSVTFALFVLAIETWEGAPSWYLMGAALLGVIGPLGTWAISRQFPETGRVAWMLMAIAGGIIAIDALFRLVGMLGA